MAAMLLPISVFAQEQLAKVAIRGTKSLFKSEAKVLAKEGVENANKVIIKDAFKTGTEEIGKDYIKKASAKQLVRGAVRKNILKEIKEKELGSILRYGTISAKKELENTDKSIIKEAISSKKIDKEYAEKVLESRKQLAQKQTAKKTISNKEKTDLGKIILSRKFNNPEELISFLRKENPKLAEYVKQLYDGYKEHSRADFMKYLVYEKTADGKTIIRNTKYKKSMIVIDGNKVYAKAGNVSAKEGELNMFLANKVMMPDMEYVVDGGAFVYKTDKYGRVVSAEADLGKAKSVQRSPKRGGQSYNSDAKGGKEGDDGGHLFAHQMNGPEEAINIVPMDASFNRKGKWREMEEKVTQLMNSGKDVKVKQYIKYEGNTLRPVEIEVHIIVDGVTTKYKFKQ